MSDTELLQKLQQALAPVVTVTGEPDDEDHYCLTLTGPNEDIIQLIFLLLDALSSEPEQ
jgi:hypothetical protein